MPELLPVIPLIDGNFKTLTICGKTERSPPIYGKFREIFGYKRITKCVKLFVISRIKVPVTLLSELFLGFQYTTGTPNMHWHAKMTRYNSVALL